MAVLFLSPSENAEQWRDMLLRFDPNIDFRCWPETGRIEEIEFALVWRPPAGELKRYPNLKVIFSLGAGVDSLMREGDLPPGIPVVRLVDRGLTASMTEYVLLHVLRYHRRVPELEALQRRQEWKPLAYPLPWERKVGVMGLGVLGGDAAAKLSALGFDVAGWSRSPKELPGVSGFHGDAGLIPFLARSEILVCLLPLTPATAGILNARTLAALPRGASIINAARGGHVVETDLLAALDSEQIAYATLDVFHEEPLPSDHPFWTHPRITVTPHIASATPPQTAAETIFQSMRLAREGRPLPNLVDLATGY
ncbi:2-hydroxyacid dehydrogenase [Rhodospirillaceae bacterium SYSU D60014]|uniref:2-hydroxyacid dehydrogenase n=1 Tax=Virgifigura deserti TaxID=2268457 RepID=UPI000E66B207